MMEPRGSEKKEDDGGSASQTREDPGVFDKLSKIQANPTGVFVLL